MTRLLVVRHAQSTWNAEGRWQGSADPPLSSAGERQAQAAATSLASLLDDRALAPLTSVWSSDLSRARRTAALLASGIDWPGPLGLVPDLREHDVGAWSGLTRPEIAARWPGAIEAWSAGRLGATPGGESRAAFDARVRSAMVALTGRVGPGPALVVSHGGVLRSVARWLGLAERAIGHLDGYLLAARGGGALHHCADVALLGEGGSKGAPSSSGSSSDPGPAGEADQPV